MTKQQTENKAAVPSIDRRLLSRVEIDYYALARVRVGRWWRYRGIISPFTRLFYIERGGGIIRHERQEIRLRPGTLVISPPFLPVDYLCNSWCDNLYAIVTCRLRQGYELFSLPLENYALKAPPHTAARVERLAAMNPQMGLTEVDPGHPDYNALIWNADRRLPGIGAQMETQGLLRILLSPFLEQLAGDEHLVSTHRLYEILIYIQQNLDREMTLKELAGIMDLHPTYFSDLFHRLIGMRPVAYINRKRIEQAQLLLMTTTLSIKEISYRLGFSDPNYFTRVFKKQTGSSPRLYRRAHV